MMYRFMSVFVAQTEVVVFMCEECETEAPHENYAQKRARIAAYWTPMRYRPVEARADARTPASVAATDAARGLVQSAGALKASVGTL